MWPFVLVHKSITVICEKSFSRVRVQEERMPFVQAMNFNIMWSLLLFAAHISQHFISPFKRRRDKRTYLWTDFVNMYENEPKPIFIEKPKF